VGLRELAIGLGLLLGALGFRRWVGLPLWVANSAMEPAVVQGSLVWLWPQPPALGELAAVRPFPGEPWALSRLVAVGPAEVHWDGLRLRRDGLSISSEVTGSWVSDCGEQFPETRTESHGGRSVRVIPGGAPARVNLADGQALLLGDRRGMAEDSRQWGAVSVDGLEMSVPLVLFSVRLCGNGARTFHGPHVLW
jgi:hypothetical protein